MLNAKLGKVEGSLVLQARCTEKEEEKSKYVRQKGAERERAKWKGTKYR